jgi:hypothetical protein
MDEPTAIGHPFNIANAAPSHKPRSSKPSRRSAKKTVKFVRIPRDSSDYTFEEPTIGHRPSPGLLRCDISNV